MNFVRYIDCRYQELAIITARSQYSSVRDGKENALQLLLSCYRAFFSLIHIPWALGGFILVNLGLLKAPTAALEELKAQYSEATKRRTKLAKKIGYNAPTKGSESEFN